MAKAGELDKARKLYIPAAEALNKILAKTKDDKNFQSALKVKLNNTLNNAEKISIMNSEKLIEKKKDDFTEGLICILGEMDW